MLVFHTSAGYFDASLGINGVEDSPISSLSHGRFVYSTLSRFVVLSTLSLACQSPERRIKDQHETNKMIIENSIRKVLVLVNC
jgi:hypothetical protein